MKCIISQDSKYWFASFQQNPFPNFFHLLNNFMFKMTALDLAILAMLFTDLLVSPSVLVALSNLYPLRLSRTIKSNHWLVYQKIYISLILLATRLSACIILEYSMAIWLPLIICHRRSRNYIIFYNVILCWELLWSINLYF